MSHPTRGKLCRYTRLDNGIHELVFVQPGYAAIDESIEHARTIFESTSPGEVARILADVHRSEMLPLLYAFERIQKWLADYPDHPRIHCATLYAPGSHPAIRMDIVNSFMNLLHFAHFRLRFFPYDQRDEAIGWLLADEE